MKTVARALPRPVTVQAPPAKAYTLRALLFGALATGTSTLRRPLLAEDQLNMIACLEGLGVTIEKGEDLLKVHGVAGRFRPIREELHVGDSGVTMNFLTAAACFSDKPVVLGGTPRLNERPIQEVVDGVRQLGARVDYLGAEGLPPVRIHPTGLGGGRAAIHGAVTSQYFSSLVISSALARGPVVLECLDEMTERPYFDISTAMMADFGVKAVNHGYKRIEVAPQAYGSRDYLVEGDFSSASFLFLVAAVLGSTVRVEGLNQNSVQGDKRFLDLLERMGCRVAWDGSAVEVTGGDLVGIEEDMSDIPDLVPPMAVAAAFARGTTRFTRVGHLVHKESNRVVAMETELRKMGVDAGHDAETMTVVGNRTGIHGASVSTYKDHRIAMSLAVAGLAVGDQHVENPGCVAKSFPDFWEKLALFA
ncbi:MAG TPA: 3-phosphoshikimate 1-carboxyvinyltransferase [Spirochaetia bacterium]|nr:3-phosphoshikimate 1-carboxyvinyltransferase [Spirochaetia bacterium]